MKNRTLQDLYRQRLHAVELHRAGHGVMQVARESGLSYPCARQTIDLYESEGIEAIQPGARGRKKGAGRLLNQEQEAALQKLIQEETPRQLGQTDAQWTHAAVAQLVARRYGVVLSSRAIGNYLARWRLSASAPDVTQAAGGVRKTDAGVVANIESQRPAWGPQTHRDQANVQTVAGRITARLRNDIITLGLQPDERLAFDKLTDRYRVGSSPIREALFQLIGEGLVISEAHRGFTVAPINTAEMLDISTLRAELEAQALRQSIQHGDDDWEARVLSANHHLKKAAGRIQSGDDAGRVADMAEWEHHHRNLHTALCSACGSPWTLHFIDILYEHLERYRRYFWQYAARVSGAGREHEGIVQAALARDADAAVRQLRRHFQTQAELSLQSQVVPSGR
ncbi:FCD domain-containing protein [Castellaniella caeni]|uniref:FCD domain-containing protein n=1 Tax=Castellaniella caeni TaxID=266123 RepID=UPI00082DCC6F|nr:FCD domain-containing protein [Castellaniella caeni]